MNTHLFSFYSRKQKNISVQIYNDNKWQENNLIKRKWLRLQGTEKVIQWFIKCQCSKYEVCSILTKLLSVPNLYHRVLTHNSCLMV